MSEVVNVIVAFAVIVFLFRWVTTSNGSPADRNTTNALGFRPKHVTPEMVETIHAMFPDIPSDNIRFDLLRTGSVELTSNKILERGFLEAPPAAYYNIYPRTEQRSAAGAPQPATNNTAIASSSSKKPKDNLISRYRLEERLQNDDVSAAAPEAIGGKAVWEDTAEKREMSLRERKAQMILAARQRLLAQQQEAGADKKE